MDSCFKDQDGTIKNRRKHTINQRSRMLRLRNILVIVACSITILSWNYVLSSDQQAHVDSNRHGTNINDKKNNDGYNGERNLTETVQNGNLQVNNLQQRRVSSSLKRRYQRSVSRDTANVVVGTLDLEPINSHDFQCLYYPLMVNATKPFYIHNVTFTTLKENVVALMATYQSLEKENIVSMLTLLRTADKPPTIEYCNDMWKNMTPNFLVQLDAKTYSEFRPIIIQARQQKLPLICVRPISGIVDHRMGYTLRCPIEIFMFTMLPFPAIDCVIWVCGKNLYTYIPKSWLGSCAPYWIEKTAKFNSDWINDDKGIFINEQEILSDNNGSQIMVDENDKEAIYKDLNIPLDTDHPITSNLWYKSIKKRVRKITQDSCYACSLIPQSTEGLFPHVAVPLKGQKSLPSLCVMAYQYIIQTHPSVGFEILRHQKFKPIIKINNMHIGKTHTAVYKIEGLLHAMTGYVAYSNISISQEQGEDIHEMHVTIFSISNKYPSLLGCSSFYRKHLFQNPIDLSISPYKVPASRNESDVFDLCMVGQKKEAKKEQIVGFLASSQCQTTNDGPGDYNEILETGTVLTPGFYWCCGNNVWTALPPLFRGVCGICSLNDVLFVVQPTDFYSKQNNSSRTKRNLEEAEGYIHLKNTDPKDLAKRYYELEPKYRIFTHTQLVFKTIFWNTELQFDNHYLIALTRHDVASIANATVFGFKSLGNEVAMIRRFSIDNRIALDAGTAPQGGVCAIVGEGCCTYLPSESEGLGNLTIAIRNIKEVQESISRTNVEVRESGGYRNMPILDSVARLFQANPMMAWILSVAGPILIIILIVVIVLGCCFPILRALILKSVNSITNMTLVQNPVRNVNFYLPPERQEMDSDSSTSTNSVDPYDNDD